MMTLPNRSFLLNLPTKTNFIKSSISRTKVVKAVSIQAKIQKSPKRMCILTQKTLPCALMIQFKIARLPNPSLSASSSTATSEENARRVLDSLERQPTYFLPSNLQNPRFEVAKGGRSAWVICWKSAVNMLAAKGKWKRLSPTSTMLTRSIEKIGSDLATRIVQEVEMFCEILKSREKFIDGKKEVLRGCPVSQLTIEQNEQVKMGVLVGLERKGMKLDAIISCEEDSSQLSSTLIPNGVSTNYPGPMSIFKSSIPFYNLPKIFLEIHSPSSAISSKSNLNISTRQPSESVTLTSPADSRENLFLSVQTSFDQTIALFARRSSTASIPSTSSTSKIYAIYSPLDSVPHAEQTLPQSDTIPLLLALWRMRLWTGEGWSQKQKDSFIAMAKMGKKKIIE